MPGLDRRWFVLRLPPALTFHTRNEVKAAVRMILRDGFRCVILNAAGCDALDTTGAGLLVQLAREARNHGARLVVTNLGGQPRELWDVCRLDGAIATAATAAEVTAACAREAA